MVAVLYLNLDRDTARRQAIESKLLHAGIHNAERIPAVLGRNLPEWLVPYFPFSRPTNGEVGCYASHLVAMRLIIERGLDAALVLEDDANIEPEALRVIDALLRVVPKGWDIVHLDGRLLDRPFAFKPLCFVDGDRRLVRYSRVPWGTAGYLISAAGAAKLLAKKPRGVPIDHEMRAPWLWNLDSYGVEPSPISQDDYPSSIDARTGKAARPRGLDRVLDALRMTAFNVTKLGLGWWFWCLTQNAAHKVVREIAGRRLANRLLPLGCRLASNGPSFGKAAAPVPERASV